MYDQINLKGKYVVTARDAEGNIAWIDSITNVVPTVGKNDILDKGLEGGAQTLYMGIISSVDYTTGPAVGDTMSSHGGWKEAGPTNAPNYDEASRPLMVWNAAAAGSKSTSADRAFNINEAGTVKGCFISSGQAKDGTSGILISAGVFDTGDKVVDNGYTLNVSYQMDA